MKFRNERMARAFVNRSVELGSWNMAWYVQWNWILLYEGNMVWCGKRHIRLLP
jgi:hypothetical protein